MTTSELTAMREELRRRRRALLQAARGAEAELSALRAEERGPELEEEAQAEQGLTDLARLGEAEREELKRIDGALARMEEGRYGACVECGVAIDPKRLRALPWAVRCAACATAAEGPVTRSS